MKIHHFTSLDSTQDEARKVIKGTSTSIAPNTNNDCFATSTTEQTKGRGTSGRGWISHKGNAFVTIAIPVEQRVTSSVNIPITLFPIQMGIIVCKRIRQVFENFGIDPSIVKVKWPNDVLVEQQKIAGILIESEVHSNTTWFLVGIGVNLQVTPKVDKEGQNKGRDATCIYDHCASKYHGDDKKKTMPQMFVTDLVSDIQTWLESSECTNTSTAIYSDCNKGESIVKEWESMAEFGIEQVLRSADNEVIIPLGLESDGRLRIRGNDGTERVLCTDYLI